MIDCLGFYAVSAVFQPCNGGLKMRLDYLASCKGQCETMSNHMLNLITNVVADCTYNLNCGGVSGYIHCTYFTKCLLFLINFSWRASSVYANWLNFTRNINFLRVMWISEPLFLGISFLRRRQRRTAVMRSSYNMLESGCERHICLKVSFWF